jgi:putative transposase
MREPKMYKWRQMTPEQREKALRERKQKRHPHHGPPHREGGGVLYHLTAACYEHRPIIGHSEARLAEFETRLLEVFNDDESDVLAWCVLPNHYHLLAAIPRILEIIKKIGQLHGRTSYFWNRSDDQKGRKCWHRCVERAIRSERHKWVTMNYIHHNPVHHGYVEKWGDWPFSSAVDFLERHGREEAERYWKNYPLLEYGKGWDAPDL